MFSSLEEQLARDEAANTSGRTRIFRFVMIGIVSVLVFGGLYASLLFVE